MYFVIYLEKNSVAELVLVPKVGGGAAGVHGLVAVVLPRHVGEVQVALHVHRQPGRVDCLQGPVCALQLVEL